MKKIDKVIHLECGKPATIPDPEAKLEQWFGEEWFCESCGKSIMDMGDLKIIYKGSSGVEEIPSARLYLQCWEMLLSQNYDRALDLFKNAIEASAYEEGSYPDLASYAYEIERFKNGIHILSDNFINNIVETDPDVIKGIRALYLFNSLTDFEFGLRTVLFGKFFRFKLLGDYVTKCGSKASFCLEQNLLDYKTIPKSGFSKEMLIGENFQRMNFSSKALLAHRFLCHPFIIRLQNFHTGYWIFNKEICDFALSEFIKYGFAKYPLPLSNRLTLLKKEQLTELLKTKNVKAVGAKSKIIQQIMSCFKEQEILDYIKDLKIKTGQHEALVTDKDMIEVGVYDFNKAIEKKLHLLELLDKTIKRAIHQAEILNKCLSDKNYTRFTKGIRIKVKNTDCKMCAKSKLTFNWEEINNVPQLPFHPECTCEYELWGPQKDNYTDTSITERKYVCPECYEACQISENEDGTIFITTMIGTIDISDEEEEKDNNEEGIPFCNKCQLQYQDAREVDKELSKISPKEYINKITKKPPLISTARESRPYYNYRIKYLFRQDDTTTGFDFLYQYSNIEDILNAKALLGVKMNGRDVLLSTKGFSKFTKEHFEEITLTCEEWLSDLERQYNKNFLSYIASKYKSLKQYGWHNYSVLNEERSYCFYAIKEFSETMRKIAIEAENEVRVKKGIKRMRKSGKESISQ